MRENCILAAERDGGRMAGVSADLEYKKFKAAVRFDI